MTEKELLIDKLSDSMDPSNAREFVERVIREATLPLGGEGRALIEQWRQRADRLDDGAIENRDARATIYRIAANELEALLTVSGAPQEENDQKVTRMDSHPQLDKQRATASPVAPSAIENAWVIERHVCSSLHYWTGRPKTMLGDWSSQHEDAIRFARRADAEAMLTWHCDSIGNVVEHGWVSLLTVSGAAHQEAEQNDLNTRTDAPTIRSEELLRRTLSMLCNYVWTKQLRPGEHMWSIPVDKERDFDCILSDAIDELIARRAVLSLMSDK